MKMITGNRGCGLTTELLTEAMANGGGVYICATKKRVDFMKQKYRDYPFDAPPMLFLTLNEIATGSVGKFNSCFRNFPIYIDDFNDCLKIFLSNYGLNGDIASIGATW